MAGRRGVLANLLFRFSAGKYRFGWWIEGYTGNNGWVFGKKEGKHVDMDDASAHC
jgi:hypothetical protein